MSQHDPYAHGCWCGVYHLTDDRNVACVGHLLSRPRVLFDDGIHVRCALHLVCSGAEIGASEYDLTLDRTGQLGKINFCLISLRNGRGVKPLMSDEERRFMWNLAFSFTIQYRGAAFKAYYAIRSFITFHGIFMAHGYIFGPGSFWRRAEIETKEKYEFDINECEENCMWLTGFNFPPTRTSNNKK